MRLTLTRRTFLMRTLTRKTFLWPTTLARFVEGRAAEGSLTALVIDAPAVVYGGLRVDRTRPDGVLLRENGAAADGAACLEAAMGEPSILAAADQRRPQAR